MESTALEEKINKIRLRNEEIKRRYEEVEADKKNAAKLDALVEPIPVEDWPERKEPPEFSGPPLKNTNKPKHSTNKRYSDQGNQYYSSSGDGKKAHSFADGQGPPPDPKYNFLADSERDEHGEQIPKDTERNRGKKKPTRGVFKRRGSGRDWHAKEQWNQHTNPGDMTLPEYEAWRAERNRIDEARISRQRTAEGNWRREWDNDKVHLVDDVSKRDNRVTLGEVASRQDHSENEKYYRAPRTAPRNSHYVNPRESYHGNAVNEANKNHGTFTEAEKRVVVATDKSIKVLVNQGSTPQKSSVMSVKVSSPNIAGTGRVGPRQRPRVMYSSQEADAPLQDTPTLVRQKSIDEKTRGRQSDQAYKVTSPKSPHPQRHRESDAKSSHPIRKDNERAEGSGRPIKKDSQKSPHPQRRGASNYPPKSPRVNRKSTESVKQKRNSDNHNTSSVQDGSKVENMQNSLDCSVGINDDKSCPATQNHVENKNNSVLLKESTETSVSPTMEAALETINNAELEQSLLHISESSENASVWEISESVGGSKKECLEDSYGEASGTREAKHSDNSTDVDVESVESQVINCSANSGLTSNDSGYIELPSNDSIHDVSENDTTKTSGFADTSSDSLHLADQSADDHLVIEYHDLEANVTDDTVDIAKPSSSLQKSSELESLFSGNAEENKCRDETESKREGVDNEAHCTVNEIENIEPTCVQSEDKSSSSLHTETYLHNTVKETVNVESIDKVSEKENSDDSQAEADTKPQDIINENPNSESIQIQSDEKNAICIPEETQTTKDENSGLTQVESLAEGAEKSHKNLEVEAKAHSALSQSEQEEKLSVIAEKSRGIIENTQEESISNDESKNSNDIQENAATETSSSPIMKD